MDSYVFVNYANESREHVLPFIAMLEKAGIRALHGSVSEEKIRNSIFVVHMSTPASRGSRSYRRAMNYAVRFDKDCILLHMKEDVLLSDAEKMLDAVLAAFKYSCLGAGAVRGSGTENDTLENAGTEAGIAEAPAGGTDSAKAPAGETDSAETSAGETDSAEIPAEGTGSLETVKMNEEVPDTAAVNEENTPDTAAGKEDHAPEHFPVGGEPEENIEELRALSERERLYLEGRKLLEGRDTEPDPEKAFEYFKQSANQGHTKAQYQMCLCYDEGIGVRKNIQEAARWCEMAAYGGYDKAQSEIGYCYEYGHGVPRNTREAVRWYRIAAQQGNIEAKNNLAFCYQKGRGLTKNVDEAIRLYSEAAEAGHASALYNLGFCFWYGEGVPIDKERAVELFQESARRGNVRAEQMMKILNQHDYINRAKE